MPPNYGFLPSPPIKSNSPSVCLLSALQGPIIVWCLSHHLLPPHCPRHSLLSAENWCKSGCCWNDHSIKTEVLTLSTYQKLLLHINVQRQAITSTTVNCFFRWELPFPCCCSVQYSKYESWFSSFTVKGGKLAEHLHTCVPWH